MLHESVSKRRRTTLHTAANLLDLISQARIEANYAEINPNGGHMMNLRLLLNELEAEAKTLPLSLWEVQTK